MSDNLRAYVGTPNGNPPYVIHVPVPEGDVLAFPLSESLPWEEACRLAAILTELSQKAKMGAMFEGVRISSPKAYAEHRELVELRRMVDESAKREERLHEDLTRGMANCVALDGENAMLRKEIAVISERRDKALVTMRHLQKKIGRPDRHTFREFQAKNPRAKITIELPPFEK